MELPGVDRHARHLIFHALQRQIAPAAADAGDLSPGTQRAAPLMTICKPVVVPIRKARPPISNSRTTRNPRQIF